ncbi:MAG: hypothetical protein AAB217_24610, partial [Chloroflexota bacterium]
MQRDIFKAWLGEPFREAKHNWGEELRYYIDGSRIDKFHTPLHATIREHHNPLKYKDELKDCGFPKTAHTLEKRYSMLPTHHETRMGNFAEVIGTEYGKHILGYKTTLVLPKHFNPNPEQSMKGVDILGIQDDL